MTFAQRLERTAGLVDARLAAVLAEKSETARADGGGSERLDRALRHAVLGGGKRIRPFLVVESAALFGLETSAALDAACAVEVVHCYSLAHDDLPAMDNDETRRGRPTVWKAFDDWTAILAGDALLTLAFEILSSPATHADPDIRLALIGGLSKAAGAAGMVGGQALDLEADKLGHPSTPGPDHVLRLQAMKTGALIAFACEAGAILARASPEERGALRSYGAAVGLAFQIADDFLDTDGDAAAVGKAVAKDAAAGKATLVAHLGREAAQEELARLEQLAAYALEPFGARAAVLGDAVRFIARRSR